MKDIVIRFDDVTKYYQETLALDHMNLEVAKGEFLTTIGNSGGGKTTLLKLVNGLLRPDSGHVYVNGEDVATVDQIALRRKIGYVIQNIGLFPHMNVAKNIAYVPSLSKLWGKETEQQQVLELLAVVGLSPELATRYPDELSGGQQQRVGIARALAAKPEIMLMDEPFGAVDEITRRALQDEIADIHRRLGVTVVFVTHDIKEALKLGTQVLVMDGGRVAQLGAPQQILANPSSDFVAKLVEE